MIKAEIVGDRSVLNRFSRMLVDVDGIMLKEMTSLSIDLQRKVRQGKLTGQVLKVQTGTLRRSIQYKITQTDTSIYSIVGTNVPYGRFWELGWSGVQTVRQHTRRTFEKYVSWSKSGSRSGAKVGSEKKRMSGMTLVRAHKRNVNVKPRSFLGSALEEMRAKIKARLNKALVKGLKATAGAA